MKTIFPIISVILTFAGIAGGAWVSEAVTSNGDVGSGCSIVTDQWNRPCVAYADKTNKLVIYARFTGTQWVFETAATGVEIQGETSLAVDTTGRPSIVFGDIITEEVKYASKSGSTWTVETVAEGQGTGRLVTLALSPAGPVVLYSVEVGTTPGISYAYRDAGVWETETVRSGGVSAALCLDGNSIPHVVYQDVATTTVRHTSRTGTTWSTPIVVAPGIDCDVVYGPDSSFHVSYSQPANAGLGYARSTDGNVWATEAISTATGKPAYTHIAVTAAGNKFISYFDFATYDLHVSKNVGTVWTDELVAANEYVGNYNALTANGPNSHAYVAYYDNRPADLKVAYYNLSAISLRSFNAKTGAGAVNVSWSTAGDAEAAGFNLYRANGNYLAVKPARLNAELITGRSPYRYVDADVDPGVTYQYWLEAVSASGAGETFGPAECRAGSLPSAFALRQNYPNPGSDKTTIVFSLPTAGDATIAVYDVTGRKVVTAFDGPAAAGENILTFALSDFPAGVYTYRLEAGGAAAVRKMVVTK